MSLITRCPACETMFKVVPDQLRISEGWVRCGQCGEIFNASQNLVATEPAPLAAPQTGQPAPPVAVAAPPETPAYAPLADGQAVATPIVEPVADYQTPGEDPTVLATMAPEPQRGQFEQKVWDLEPVYADPTTEGLHGAAKAMPATGTEELPHSAAAPNEPLWIDTTVPPDPPASDLPQAGTPGREIPQSPLADTPVAPRVAAQDDDEDPISFLQEDQAAGFWSRRPVRLVLVLAAVLLAAVLAAQVLVQERNRVVLLEPSTRPVLQTLCRLAGCEIGPLRQIESIVIDSSSFGRLRADGYRLAFSLRNQAPIDIAMPAIELSLTDTQDQALIRRVIMPAEYGAPTPVLAGGTDWSGTLALNIRAGASTERIAGYRLLAFYP